VLNYVLLAASKEVVMAKNRSSADKTGKSADKAAGDVKEPTRKSPLAKLVPKVAAKGRSATKSNSPPAQTGVPEEQPASRKVVMMFSHDQIARRAYDIWQKRGRPQGQEREHWAMAEAELQRGSSI
jgi:hypothetical protein